VEAAGLNNHQVFLGGWNEETHTFPIFDSAQEGFLRRGSLQADLGSKTP